MFIDPELVMRVDEIPDEFRPLEIWVPVAHPSPLVNYSTCSIVLLSLLYIIYQLYKA